MKSLNSISICSFFSFTSPVYADNSETKKSISVKVKSLCALAQKSDRALADLCDEISSIGQIKSVYTDKYSFATLTVFQRM